MAGSRAYLAFGGAQGGPQPRAPSRVLSRERQHTDTTKTALIVGLAFLLGRERVHHQTVESFARRVSPRHAGAATVPGQHGSPESVPFIRHLRLPGAWSRVSAIPSFLCNAPPVPDAIDTHKITSDSYPKSCSTSGREICPCRHAMLPTLLARGGTVSTAGVVPHYTSIGACSLKESSMREAPLP